MSQNDRKNIIIVGAGPLTSHSLSLWLASQNWEIVLISRSQDKLDGYAKEIQSIHPNTRVLTRIADASQPSSLTPALDWAAAQLGGKVDVLCYNAANVSPCDLMFLTPEELESSFKTAAVGTLVAGQWFSKHANTDRTSQNEFPLFLVPGGVLDKTPYPSYASLSAAKSASQNLARQFSMVLPEKYQILVGVPTIVEPIVPLEGGGWATKSIPEVIVDKIFRPFFEEREKIKHGELAVEKWTLERVW
ncbi:hypothetical protein BP5796_12100 [Coleophoma crateriformis]|uniref:NAD(P)-binding protein n=1 Tax=Coleophoma crateriformis TaxID=565419 RepID=A0A3D8QBF4_9HELO|nr:hypothetical protein BP5796_12100 [Coleophoma crateriformis]